MPDNQDNSGNSAETRSRVEMVQRYGNRFLTGMGVSAFVVPFLIRSPAGRQTAARVGTAIGGTMAFNGAINSIFGTPPGTTSHDTLDHASNAASVVTLPINNSVVGVASTLFSLATTEDGRHIVRQTAELSGRSLPEIVVTHNSSAIRAEIRFPRNQNATQDPE